MDRSQAAITTQLTQTIVSAQASFQISFIVCVYVCVCKSVSAGLSIDFVASWNKRHNTNVRCEMCPMQ